MQPQVCSYGLRTYVLFFFLSHSGKDIRNRLHSYGMEKNKHAPFCPRSIFNSFALCQIIVGRDLNNLYISGYHIASLHH